MVKRLGLLFAAAAFFAIGSMDLATAVAYPVGPTISLDVNVVTPGESLTLTINGFCAPFVGLQLSGAETVPLGRAPVGSPFVFTAPATLGAYTITATGTTTCVPSTGLADNSGVASASDTFLVVAVAVGAATPVGPGSGFDGGTPAITKPVVITPDVTKSLDVTKPSVIKTTPAATAATTPRTGINSLRMVQAALATLLGGCVLILVARSRRQRRALT